MMEAEVAVMQFEDGGEDHEPRNTGGHLETEKKARKWILPKSLPKKPALPTP